MIVIICRDGEEILGQSEHLAPVWQANSVNNIPYYCARSYFSQVCIAN